MRAGGQPALLSEEKLDLQGRGLSPPSLRFKHYMADVRLAWEAGPEVKVNAPEGQGLPARGFFAAGLAVS